MTVSPSFYADRGWNVLPASIKLRHPTFCYSDMWDKRVRYSDDQFENKNVMVMCGTNWNLLVIDLDGEEGRDRWNHLSRDRLPITWEVRTGSGGTHYWFRIPPRYRTKKIPKALLWGDWDAQSNGGKGSWKKHQGIERLCDHSLITAPPSVHHRTEMPYEFVGRALPTTHPLPSHAPDWLVAMNGIRPPCTIKRDRCAYASCSYHDKLGLAVRWGLRVASRTPTQAGWVSCYRIDGEDRVPSASFNVSSGVYTEFSIAGKMSLSLVDLAVALRAFPCAQDAVHYIRSL